MVETSVVDLSVVLEVGVVVVVVVLLNILVCNIPFLMTCSGSCCKCG